MTFQFLRPGCAGADGEGAAVRHGPAAAVGGQPADAAGGRLPGEMNAKLLDHDQGWVRGTSCFCRVIPAARP